MDFSIVIVDDLYFQCEIVKDLLIESGHKDISIFTNPEKAVSKINEIVNQGKKVFIITDFCMPELNGYDLLEKFEGVPSVKGAIMTSVPNSVPGMKFDVLNKNSNGFFENLNLLLKQEFHIS